MGRRKRLSVPHHEGEKLRVTPKTFGPAAGALLVVLMSAQPANALVCAIAPDDPQNPGVIERTIAGQEPMGGSFDLVVLGVVEGIAASNSDGYRDVAMDVRVVLRGTASREYSFAYPAAADEPEPMFLRGATYLVAIESKGVTGGPTASECSATKQIVDPAEISRYIDLSANPVIYGELPSGLAGDEAGSISILGGLLVATLAVAVAWLVLRSSSGTRHT